MRQAATPARPVQFFTPLNQCYLYYLHVGLLNLTTVQDEDDVPGSACFDGHCDESAFEVGKLGRLAMQTAPSACILPL